MSYERELRIALVLREAIERRHKQIIEDLQTLINHFNDGNTTTRNHKPNSRSTVLSSKRIHRMGSKMATKKKPNKPTGRTKSNPDKHGKP